jgi:peptidoglycan/xylan/chitin deacetylase (PgdA/CDA1 family)
LGGKREWLADLLFKTRLIKILSHLKNHNKLVILNYHRIRPDAAPAATPFDDGVFTVSADQFFRQMNWLKRHTRILSEQDLIDHIATNSYPQTNRPSTVITFDDGYEDNFSIAYPILRSLQIPAIFFICTEMIWERKLCWWDSLAYLIKKCRKPSMVIHDHEFSLQNNRQKIIADFQQRMKEFPCGQIRQEIRLLSEATEIDLPADDMQDGELMTREQIREMAENRMTIGSHAHTHQALSCLEPHEHQTELIVSKQLLEQTTGQPVKSLSYPFGRYQYIPASIQDAARKCGYQLGFTSNWGVNYLNQISDMDIKRFSGELEKVSTVSLIAVWPELFAGKGEGFPKSRTP